GTQPPLQLNDVRGGRDLGAKALLPQRRADPLRRGQGRGADRGTPLQRFGIGERRDSHDQPCLPLAGIRRSADQCVVDPRVVAAATPPPARSLATVMGSLKVIARPRWRHSISHDHSGCPRQRITPATTESAKPTAAPGYPANAQPTRPVARTPTMVASLTPAVIALAEPARRAMRSPPRRPPNRRTPTPQCEQGGPGGGVAR